MSLQLIICFLSISAGTMIGFSLYKKEFAREKYFENIINLCNTLIADMRFSQRTIGELVEVYISERNSPLDGNLKEYLSYIKEKNTELSISKGLLKKNEHSDVICFLKSLGTSDSHTQIFEIENYKNKFEIYKEHQSKFVDKHAKNYVKLGFLFGLAIGILLI